MHTMMNKINTVSKRIAFLPVFPFKKLYLLTLLLIPFFVYLGFWQLQRYHLKLSLENLKISQSQKPFLTELSQNETASLPYRKASLKGYFINDRVIYKREKQNQILGYRIFIPFKPLDAPDNPALLLVDRGFSVEAPSLNPINGIQTLTGTFQKPGTPFSLQKRIAQPQHWPQLVAAIDLNKLSEMLQVPLYPVILQLSKADPLAFDFLEPTLKSEFIPKQHLGYAIQWFLMAIALSAYLIKHRKYFL